MTTITIDIPDNYTDEVLAQLEKLGVKVRESQLDRLDSISKEDYKKQFEQKAKANKTNLLKYL